MTAATPSPPTSQSGSRRNDGSGVPLVPETRISETTSCDRGGERQAADEAEDEQDHAAHAELPAHVCGREPLGLEVEEVALLVVQLADHADPEAEHGERERDEPCCAERDDGRASGVAGELPLVGDP
jgi:hypothetical protein